MNRNKLIVLLVFSVSLGLMSMSFSSSSPSESSDSEDGKAGHNGSPGEQTCAKSTCHTSFTLNSGPGSVSITAPGMTNWQYTPGQTYTIQVTVAQTSVGLFGFGFEALLGSGANAGTLTAGTGSHALSATVSGNSRKTITHLEDGGLSSNSHTFSFTWLAPATAVPVTFYAAGNAANNNGLKTGDYIYTTSQAVSPVVMPTAPTITADNALDLCNGESVTLSVTAQANVTFAWYNQNDVQVATGTSFTTTEAGCFDVVATASGGTANSTNTLCTTVSVVDASFTGILQEYCVTDEADAVDPVTPGGTLSGTGTSGNTFDPQQAGPGQFTITYSVVNGSGCADSESIVVTVHDVFSAAFTIPSPTLCASAEPVELTAEDEGGVFSGAGVSGNMFDPSVGEGVYEITYTIGEANCVQTSSQEIEVFSVPDASFTGLETEYCSDNAGSQLVPATEGGNFTGNGISGFDFIPGNAGAGAHDITYTVEGENSCSNSSVQSVLVNQFVVADFVVSDNSVCENGEDILLTPVEAGGSFNGAGVDIDIFDPSLGEGSYEVFYSVGEGSCGVTSSQIIEVLPVEDASFTGLEEGYCVGADAVQLIPAVEGGTFTGNGVQGDLFTPSAEFAGENTITYNIEAENGCVSQSSQTVLVYETLNSSFTGLATSYCADASSSELVPASQGGIFTGEGVMNGNEFDPEGLAPGIYTVEYTIEFVGCSSFTVDTTEVFAVPELSVAGLDESYCADEDAVILTPSQPTTVTGTGVDNNVFSPADAGPGSHTLSCIYVDENGCSAQWSSEVSVLPLPNESVQALDFTATADQDNATYQWLDCNNNNTPIDGATGQVFQAEENGFYAVVITMNGCDVTSDCVELIVDNVTELGDASISIYPNPANRSVVLSSASNSTIVIYDMSGHEVKRDDISRLAHTISLDEFSDGIYQVVFETNTGSYTRKLQVRK